jgi:hypothetical protein
VQARVALVELLGLARRERDVPAQRAVRRLAQALPLLEERRLERAALGQPAGGEPSEDGRARRGAVGTRPAVVHRGTRGQAGVCALSGEAKVVIEGRPGRKPYDRQSTPR